MNEEKSNIRILLVGGGTGGHFYPLIGIAEALNVHPSKPALYYAGPNAYDQDALIREGISYIPVWAGKRRRYASILNFFDIFKTLFGTLIAIVKLYVLYPDVVMSKGGYTSVPIVLGAAFLRIPIVVHESDSVFGTANRLASRFAQDIVVTYDAVTTVITHPRIHKFGIPIRKMLLQNSAPEALQSLDIDPHKPIILVIGGSQGAERINSLILDSLDELLNDFTVIHQTGKENYDLCKLTAETLITNDDARRHYRLVPFLDVETLNDVYNLAHIVISRAGSNSIYEIALHGKPSIIIPIPENISHDQRTNAYAYARTGAAVVMEEKNMSDNLLRSEIDRIMQNTEVYVSMSEAAKSFGKRDAAEHVSDLLIQIAQQH